MQELISYFMENYYPRAEIVYRLPVSVPIAEFWPVMLQYRRQHALELPLRTASGERFWYVPTDRLLRDGDALAQAARDAQTLAMPPYVQEDGIIDEAFYSSAIEGAYSTRIFQSAGVFRSFSSHASCRAERVLSACSALAFSTSRTQL